MEMEQQISSGLVQKKEESSEVAEEGGENELQTETEKKLNGFQVLMVIISLTFYELLSNFNG